jgi:hypothetical protein
MAKKLAGFVHVKNEEGEFKVFGPKDTLPAWASKKLPKRAFVDSEDGDDEDLLGGTPPPPPAKPTAPAKP